MKKNETQVQHQFYIDCVPPAPSGRYISITANKTINSTFNDKKTGTNSKINFPIEQGPPK